MSKSVVLTSPRQGSRGLRLDVAGFALLFSLAGCMAGRPPDAYMSGAAHLVPGEEITVGRGENIYAVAQKHGVNMRDIIALNELSPPFVLKPGQRLTLPNKDRYAAPIPKSAPLDPIDKGYMGPSRGSIISTSSAVTAVPLDAPPVKPAAPVAPAPTTSYVDTPLPPASDAPVAVAKTSNFSAQTSSAKAATHVREMDVKDVDLSFMGQKETAVPETAPSPAPATAPVASSSDEIPGFGWPVRGTIISAFGPKGKGRDNDGINIAAPKGAPVKAAEGGIVAYAGNDMKGFGNLVLIRHEGGWVTAYAHMQRLVVARDAIVAKGDMIGTVGTTGGVSSPQLHFEVRREGKPTDPELVMK